MDECFERFVSAKRTYVTTPNKGETTPSEQPSNKISEIGWGGVSVHSRVPQPQLPVATSIASVVQSHPAYDLCSSRITDAFPKPCQTMASTKQVQKTRTQDKGTQVMYSAVR